MLRPQDMSVCVISSFDTIDDNSRTTNFNPLLGGLMRASGFILLPPLPCLAFLSSGLA